MNFNDYEKPSVAVDIALFRCIDVDRGYRRGKGKQLQIMLVYRREEPFKCQWSLPGGFVSASSGLLDETAKTKLKEKTGISNVYMEQLKTFDMLDRDPRGRVLSVSYLGVTHEDSYVLDTDKNYVAAWFSIENGVLVSGNRTISFDSLAFDHKTIIFEALKRMKNKIEYTDLAYYLLPEKFTIKEAQLLFEIILGYRIDSFRRKLGNRIIETDEIVQRVGKPAKLFIKNKEAF